MTTTYKKPFCADLGSISEATLKTPDLLVRFIDTLTDLMDARALHGSSRYDNAPDQQAAVEEAGRLAGLLADIERELYDDDGELLDRSLDSELAFAAQHDLDALFAELEEFAPPYCYFGTHYGDGADLGFWPDWQFIEESRYCKDLPDADEIPEGYAGNALEINDHGNTTLYYVDETGDRHEIWAIV